MDNQKIAIIGLGRVGAAFLHHMLSRRGRGVELVAVAESADTPGRQLAIDAGLEIVTLDQVVALGDGVDVLFELTGLADVRHELREKLMANDNHHTVVASETIARLVLAMTQEEDLPVIPGRNTGY